MKTLLHAGCGSAPKPEAFADWREIRVDLDPACNPDCVASITAMDEIGDGGVDSVYCYHSLEHLAAHEVQLALREFFRVLRPGGSVDLATPDLQQLGKYLAAGRLEDPLYISQAGPVAALDVLYGFRRYIAAGNAFMAHRTGFTAKTLERKLIEAGFVEVVVTADKCLNLWANALRPTVQA